MTDQERCPHLHIIHDPVMVSGKVDRHRWVCSECMLEFTPMPDSAGRKHCLIYVPHSGLFFDGGDFLDGRQNRIKWNRSIPVFSSHARAVLAKEAQLASNKDWQANGHLVVLSIELRDMG